MIMDRLGKRMTDFIGTTGVKVLHAVEEVVPGLEPPRRRRVTLGKVALTAGAAIAAGVGSAAARRGGLGGVVDKVEGLASTAMDKVEGAASGNGRGSDAAEDLASKSWAELMKLAKDADIKGRSGMKKDELVKALS